MRSTIRLTLAVAAIAALASPTLVSAQATSSVEPFKVGTFEIHGAPTVGLVLRDALIVDINAANTALELNPAYPHITPPADMLELIGQYEYGIKYRLYEIVNDLVANNRLSGAGRAPYVHDVADIGFLPPIMYPGKILNAAVNFYSHVNEGGTLAERQAAQRERDENRGVPYLFLKPSRGAVVGNGHEVVIPYGRTRTDWEVELGTVIGRTARYVDANDAQDYVFGYMVTIDVSDRGGRPPGGFGQGSDWFVGKGHDTFAPQGPWIVPKEFYGDPMQNLRQTLMVDGQMLQEARAGDMIHSLWELIEYGSSIITLFPGDVINNGTSGGTSMSAGTGSTTTSAQREGSLYLQPGEIMEATVDGIGTLRMPAVAGPVPEGGTGSRLPPVDSYRSGRGGGPGGE
jgi:2-keto-4-pentenoate hydratase/2-oxohepta-3-ene-1,7-dioic acid hydratase in catechol pathway